MLKLCFMLFLPVADPEMLPHIGKIAPCVNTYWLPADTAVL